MRAQTQVSLLEVISPVVSVCTQISALCSLFAKDNNVIK